MVVAKLKSRRDNHALNDQVVLDELFGASRSESAPKKK